jgi:hypothetical protein
MIAVRYDKENMYIYKRTKSWRSMLRSSFIYIYIYIYKVMLQTTFFFQNYFVMLMWQF